MSFEALNKLIGYAFHDESLLVQALTHRSYAYEHSCGDNQRLEFLGDAILDFVIADILYREHPDVHEGELSRLRSRLVCEATLCLLAKKLDFEAFVRMGKGEKSVGGMMRPGTLADAYEAVIGAIYIDGGIGPVTEFIERNHREYLNDPDGQWLADDAKTRLQEKAQAIHAEIRYEVMNQTGPSHAPSFEVGVWIDKTCIGKGMGHNKKEAQQSAAANALDNWSFS